MRATLRRFFSSTVHELGAELSVTEVSKKRSEYKFLKLEEISDFEEVFQAPEGSVVGINLTEPFSHLQVTATLDRVQKVNSQLFEQHAQILYQHAQILEQHAQLFKEIEIIKADVRSLKMTPRFIQTYETIKKFQDFLIKTYLPTAYFELPEGNRNSLNTFLKRKSSISTKEINEFFKIPCVDKLYRMVSSGEYEEIKKFRNKRAHEFINDIDLIRENFTEIFDFFKENPLPKGFDPNSFKLSEIEEILEIIEITKESEAEDDDYHGDGDNGIETTNK